MVLWVRGAEALRHDLDLQLFHLANNLAGHWWLDRIVNYEEGLNLMKGGLLLGLYWIFWFRPGVDQQDRKATIIAALAGTITALVANRTIALALPFSQRPMYDPTIAVQALSVPVQPNLEDWSSFPSDTASYFVALAFGFWFLRRRLGIALSVWAGLYICFPRLLLGLHYPSDLVVGAMIGIVSVALLQRALLKNPIARPVLSFERARPDLFYPVMFLVSYELSVELADVRIPLRATTHALHHYGILRTSEDLFLFGLWVCVLAIPIFVAVVVLYRRTANQGRAMTLEPCGKFEAGMTPQHDEIERGMPVSRLAARR